MCSTSHLREQYADAVNVMKANQAIRQQRTVVQFMNVTFQLTAPQDGRKKFVDWIDVLHGDDGAPLALGVIQFKGLVGGVACTARQRTWPGIWINVH